LRKIALFFVMLLIIFLVACTSVEESDVSIVLYPGIDTVEIYSSYQDPGALSKAFGFNVKNTVLSNNVDTEKLGTYEIIYQVDYRGIIKQITRKVIVVDQTSPIAVLKAGIDTIKLGDIWVDSGVTATDNSLETPEVLVNGTVNSNQVGEYIIEYLISDSSGNVLKLIRYVNVQ